MTKVHLIADDSIGGVKWEYVEVGRKVVVGDYVVLPGWDVIYKVEKDPTETEECLRIAHDYEIGKFVGDVDKTGSAAYATSLDGFKALDPTDIVHVEGTRYQLAERKAEVGEKVIILETSHQIKNGTVATCTVNDEFDDGSIDTDLVYPGSDCGFLDTVFTEYRVLIPVKPTLDELVSQITPENKHEEVFAEPTADIYTLLANAAIRITQLERITGELVRAKSSLESQLRDTQNNVQTFAELAETTKELTESNTKDIAFLDERTFEKPGKPTKSAEEILREISKILERDERQ